MLVFSLKTATLNEKTGLSWGYTHDLRRNIHFGVALSHTQGNSALKHTLRAVI